MAILNDKNIAAYKTNLDALNKEVAKWKTHMANARKSVGNTEIGATFRDKYVVGRKASDNILRVIDIFESIQKDLTVLAKDAMTFYDKSVKANKAASGTK